MKQSKNNRISKTWKHWLSERDLKTCQPCRTMHGKIFPMRQLLSRRPPLHPFCRCKIRPMQAVAAGHVTREGANGADFWVKKYGYLPAHYISKSEARKNGWIPSKGNLANVLPGKVIGGDRYYNDDGHLPDAPGKIWYEADIEYASGFRGMYRLLYFNDGLIFVTYNHYETFEEVV